MKKILTPFLILFLFIQATQAAWIQKSSLPDSSRSQSSGFSINDMGYIIGGKLNNSTYYNHVWEYNTTNDTWSQKATFPAGGRESGYAIVINGKAYYGTGRSMGSIYHNDWWEFDPVLNTWTSKANVPGPTRSNAFGFGIGNKGYFGTGYDGSGKLSDFHAYDPSTDSWTAVMDYPAGPVTYVGGFSIGGKGYGVGGSAVSAIKETWEFDTTTGNWTSKADFAGAARFNPICFTIGTLGYVGIGWAGSNFADDFYEYNPVTNSWTATDPMSGGRGWAAGFSNSTKGYVFGGFTPGQSPINDLWEFSPTSTGIFNPDLSKLNYFPTITTGIIYFKFIDDRKSTVNIYSSSGKMITTLQLNDVVDLSFLPEGMYFIHSGELYGRVMVVK